MDENINFQLSSEEKERFQRHADRTGMSLSDWMRQAAAEKADSAGAGPSDEQRDPAGREAHRELIDRFLNSESERDPVPSWIPHFARRFCRRHVRRWRKRRPDQQRRSRAPGSGG